MVGRGGGGGGRGYIGVMQQKMETTNLALGLQGLGFQASVDMT